MIILIICDYITIFIILFVLLLLKGLEVNLEFNSLKVFLMEDFKIYNFAVNFQKSLYYGYNHIFI